jgi:hypothetical protein
MQNNTTGINVDAGAFGGAYSLSGVRDEGSTQLYKNTVGTGFIMFGCGMTGSGTFAEFTGPGTFFGCSVHKSTNPTTQSAILKSNGGCNLAGSGNDFANTSFLTSQPFGGRTTDALTSGFNNGQLTGPPTFAQATCGQSASAANEGALMRIKDGNTNVVGNTVSGGGANHVTIGSNGTNWVVIFV